MLQLQLALIPAQEFHIRKLEIARFAQCNNYVSAQLDYSRFFSLLLQATHENLYKYHAKEVYFGEDIDQTFEITIYFRVFCKSGRVCYRRLMLL